MEEELKKTQKYYAVLLENEEDDSLDADQKAWVNASKVIMDAVRHVRNSEYVCKLLYALNNAARRPITAIDTDFVPWYVRVFGNVPHDSSDKAANEAETIIPEEIHRLTANTLNMISDEQDASKNAAQQAILAAADAATCAKQATLAAEEVKARFLWARNMAINVNNANLVDQRYNNVCRHFDYNARNPAWLGGFIQRALARIKMLKDKLGALPSHRHAAMYALTCVILWHNKRTKKQASEWLHDFLRNTTSIDQQANPEWPSLDIQASIDEAKKEYDSTFTVKPETYKLLPLIRVAFA